ncbi:hypothetical protein NIES21_58410 (plasmid) [Anabaenopsis circularis NIES-21]|uniref:Uncharacterized protein n=1 Tax=Anabaenopsis circularis NIES-21 TaxID=1085406 RepID=A0A1Z4GR28_9CYAN|nr:hypothetical protein NIES21_58410 [Anabaenopsis circularis NIES-21]
MNPTELNITKIELTPNSGWTLNILSRRVATITDPLGNRKTSYFGFDTKEQAEKFRDWLVRKNKCSSAVIRHSERLANEWEVKAWNVPTSLILECAVKDLKESSNATISTQSTLQR